MNNHSQFVLPGQFRIFRRRVSHEQSVVGLLGGDLRRTGFSGQGHAQIAENITVGLRNYTFHAGMKDHPRSTGADRWCSAPPEYNPESSCRTHRLPYPAEKYCSWCRCWPAKPHILPAGRWCSYEYPVRWRKGWACCRIPEAWTSENFSPDSLSILNSCA